MSNGEFKLVRCNNILLKNKPLIDASGFINKELLSPMTQNTPSDNPVKTNHGVFVRKDINAGHIKLEVSEHGTLVQLHKDNAVVSEVSNVSIEVGVNHKLCDGIEYILTTTENCILIVDTTICEGWSPNTNGIRKFILTLKK